MNKLNDGAYIKTKASVKVGLTVSALILGGCGGGGGGSSLDTPSSGTNPTPTNPTPTTPTNTPGALYQGSLTQAELKDSNFNQFSGFLFEDVFDVADSATGDGVSTVDSNGNVVGGCGGTVTVNQNLDEQTLLGTLGMDFNNYDACVGTVINGGMTFTITEFDLSREDITRATINFDQLSFVGNGADWRMDGDFSVIADFDNRTETVQSTRMDVVENTTNKQYRFDNYSESTLFSDSSLFNPVGANMAGRLFLSDQGYVDISTNQSFICMLKSTAQCSFDSGRNGEIELLGTAGGRTVVSFLAHTQADHDRVLRAEIDANGDGTPEQSHLSPANLTNGGQNGGQNKAPFAYAGRNVTVQFADTQQIVLDAQASFDLENDDVTYQWSSVDVNDNGCGVPNLVQGEAANLATSDINASVLELDAVGAGDYCFKLTVSDGNRSEALEGQDHVVVSFASSVAAASRTAVKANQAADEPELNAKPSFFQRLHHMVKSQVLNVR